MNAAGTAYVDLERWLTPYFPRVLALPELRPVRRRVHELLALELIARREAVPYPLLLLERGQ
ncbi:hypothetical protein HAX54_003398, partial [Datura stramonium]|nr:hypothetical protein [Datura stramonium]